MKDISYHCVTGHEIGAVDLAGSTEVIVLDAGASVRICRKHGAPIAIDRPGETSKSSTQEYNQTPQVPGD